VHQLVNKKKDKNYVISWSYYQISLEASLKQHLFQYASSRDVFIYLLKVCKSVYHHTIQIYQPTTCNNFSSLLLDVCTAQRLSWLGHVERMPNERVAKTIYK
jgi:hypothetical protein